ncbi:TIGR00269 family protein [Candidatus Bathyarchaeota archaeon]|nr:MAG: TIGR00269 family protein [Candidatus Bathyarchaeota archaeon]
MSCNLCGQRDAVFFRVYSGEKLCKNCFILSIEKKVRKTISKYDMFKLDDRIAVAVSGGKDSLALLQILYKIEKKFPKANIFAVTVDEGIEGYRDEAVENAKEICEKLSVEHVVVSFKELYGITVDEIAQKTRDRKGDLTPCSYCGALRRKALNMIARKHGATKIATAHTLDDEVQTILLNFIHGDVFRASRVEPKLGGENGKFVQRVKPFCEIPQDEVALYAYFKNIRFQSKDCPYAELALRSEIREFLNKLEANHPGTKFVIYRSFEKVRPLLKPALKPEIKECQICGEPTGKTICEPCSLLKKIIKLEE